jgi:hypothetical protein
MTMRPAHPNSMKMEIRYSQTSQGTGGLDTTAILATAVKAIQELSAKNSSLEARLAALEARLT